MSSDHRNRRASAETRFFRIGQPPDRSPAINRALVTDEERLAAVWELTLTCLAWITRIDGVTFEEAWPDRVKSRYADQWVAVLSRKHLIQNKKASGRLQDMADVERLEQEKD
jgi:hypothetical protein